MKRKDLRLQIPASPMRAPRTPLRGTPQKRGPGTPNLAQKSAAGTPKKSAFSFDGAEPPAAAAKSAAMAPPKGETNIKVVCRFRPKNAKERATEPDGAAEMFSSQVRPLVVMVAKPTMARLTLCLQQGNTVVVQDLRQPGTNGESDTSPRVKNFHFDKVTRRWNRSTRAAH
jgi:hypothetical protein